MKLRELINHLEELSENGKNDDVSVAVEDFSGTLYGITDANIAEETFQNDIHKYIKIEIE